MSADPYLRLVDLVARLRAPDGCPWDREQTLADLRAYLLEEAHETAAAMDSASWDAILEELGDLLFQIAFISRLAAESGAFEPADPAEHVERKMIERHPHVFGNERLADASAVRQSWERRKSDQRSGGVLDGVPASLPALVASYRMTQKAAGVGFDWASPEGVFAKIEEELGEVRAATGDGTERLREEIGDLLFTVANLARHFDVDPEGALAAANRKFRQRFEHMEAALAERGDSLEGCGPDALEELWEVAKRRSSAP